MRSRTVAAALSFITAAGLAAWWLGWLPSRAVAPPPPPPQAGPVTLRDSSGAVTLALAGDTMAPRGFPQPGVDPAFDAVARIIQRASLGITNLDGQLGRLFNGTSEPAPAAPLWNAGTTQTAGELRRIGFTLISRANNHGGDSGADA